MIHSTCNIYGDVQIGEGTRMGAFCDIGNCTIGTNCLIQAFVFIPRGTVVGNNVFIGPRVTFLNDKYPPSLLCAGVIVEDDVVIGGGATILPGVRLGRGCKVGAGAVVTKDVYPGITVVGNPARPMA